ncbi:5'-3' exonuclease H3TH domain-containing protein, partial [Methylorubrum extorquens]
MTNALALGPGSRLILVDASSFVFRAYHQSLNQDPKYNARPSDGLPTGAVRLFFAKLFQFVRDGAAGVVPTHLGIVFDKGSRESHRRQLYPEYKANRSETPADLRPQMPLVREAVRAFGLPVIELDRTEADDLIATYARAAEAKGAEVVIVSADKDLQQLVSPRIRFYDAESGSKGKPGYRPERNLDVEAVVAKWEGLQPGQIGDALALIGDTSDNIPGVPGIGLKTAAQLLLEYGSLEALLEGASAIKQPKRRENLVAAAEGARLSRRLVELDCSVDLPVDPDALALPAPDGRRLVAYLNALELPALAKRVAKELGVDADRIPPDAELAASPTTAPGADGPVMPPFPAADPDAYGLVATKDDLEGWIAAARAAGRFGLHLHRGDAGAIGLGIAVEPGRAVYVPIEHRAGGDGLFGGLAPGQIDASAAWGAVGALMEDAGVRKIVHDLKGTAKAAGRLGFEIAGADDVGLMSYALESGLTGHGLPELAARHLGNAAPDPDGLRGQGRGRVDAEAVAPR